MLQTNRINQWLLIILGIICILAPAQIAKILPYLLGGIMALIGMGDVRLWRKSMQRDSATADLARGLVLLIVGISFAFQGENALFSLGITWAIIGIRKASQTLARLVQAIERHETFIFSALEFCVRIILALLLLFNPNGKFTPHLRVLGAELIVNSLQPAVKHQNYVDAISKSEKMLENIEGRKDE